MHLQDNTLLQGGRYQILRFISSGGFGNTYEGVHTMLDSRVAIKEFFPERFCDRDENTAHVTVTTSSNRDLVNTLRKKFNEEAKAIFQMKHEHIVRVTDIFEENGTAYYVMEYIDGKSLHEILKERGALPEAEAVGYIRQVADALRYVHSLNRLHLDIKPGNIMIDKDGNAMLIDFGASKHYNMESGENTSTLMGVNTPGYAPIEQSMRSFTTFSAATDIYSLGATLYKLLTGITPPDANAISGREATLQPLPGHISDGTRRAVMGAMTLVRMERPQSIDEFEKLFETTGSDDTIISVDDDEKTTTGIEPVVEKPKVKVEPKVKKEPVKKEEPTVLPSDGDKGKTGSKAKKSESKKKFLAIFAVCALLASGAVWYSVQSGIGEDSGSGTTVEQVEQVSQKQYTHNGTTFTYTGPVVGDMPDGQGVGVYKRGKYEGTYVKGARHGKGKFSDVDGGVFTGTFANDEYSEGKYVTSDGYRYEGTFKNQQPHDGVWYDAQGNYVSTEGKGNYVSTERKGNMSER